MLLLLLLRSEMRVYLVSRDGVLGIKSQIAETDRHWIRCMAFFFPLCQAGAYLPTPDSSFPSILTLYEWHICSTFYHSGPVVRIEDNPVYFFFLMMMPVAAAAAIYCIRQLHVTIRETSRKKHTYTHPPNKMLRPDPTLSSRPPSV